ncbi:MAG: GNAT family N-acetyltransferase [Desulfurococcales archaeon]|nr:GNAT family N-acetyltransferase [Desulfurococcales archaeon]
MGILVYSGVLKDGTPVEVERATPEDREKLIHFYEALSAECIYNRFMSIIRYFDPYVDSLFRGNAIVLMAKVNDKVVGVAEVVYDDRGMGESGIAVLDEYQGKGIGSLLGRLIIEEAKKNGIKKFYAYILPTNMKALQMALKHGARIVKRYSGMLYLEFDLEGLNKGERKTREN